MQNFNFTQAEGDALVSKRFETRVEWDGIKRGMHMNIKRIHFLREILAKDAQGRDRISMEFSYDSGTGRAPYFLAVPVEYISQARALYQAWGGSRGEGERVGTTVNGPWIPFIQSKGYRRKNGNP